MTALLEHVLLRGGLIGLRIGGLMSFMPFLGSVTIPARIRAIFTLLCTTLLYPTASVHLVKLTPSEWARVALSEIVVGLGMGLCLQFVFEAAQLAGQTGGFQLGFSLVNVIDPQSNVDTPVLSTFHQLFVLLLFLELNIHYWVLRGIAKSFEYVPAGTVVLSRATVGALLRAAGGMWVAAVQIATPLLFATVLIDVAVGFLSKASPQLPAILLSIPLKSLVGYAVLAIAIGLWPTLFEKQFALALGWSERLLHLAH